MEKRLILIPLVILFALSTANGFGQVKIDLKKKINKEANRRANNKTNKAVNKGFDELEKGVNAALSGEEAATENNDKNKEGADPSVQASGSQLSAVSREQGNPGDELSLNWSKYDFVPGDKILFEDNLLGEENGEFPSRWDLMRGAVENARLGDDNIIFFRGGAPIIVPYLKNPETDYLPDVFTIEFDLFMNNHNSIEVFFYDRKNQHAPLGSGALTVNHREMRLGPASSTLPGQGSTENQWAHISIAYTRGKMKAYIDETRLINIPHLSFDPTGISIHVYHASDMNRFYLKNFRLAEGGVKYYDRFLQDGKIVSNGIRFDTGKASLRPESMGVLNEICTMLKEHPEVSVCVEGHTDSDGDFELNRKLSEDRAQTVVNQLVTMGINRNRLSHKGFGESKPMAPNDTPEGKASNRRVEFVKTN